MTERFTPTLLPDIPPANDARPEAEPLTAVYLRTSLPDGSQEGPFHIPLNSKGEADLSGLPDAIRLRLARGIDDVVGQGIRIMPSDGVAFLGTLLQTGGVYGATCSRKE